ncbi:DNA mismatch repair protein [Haematococcus lacustris]|uniref:DNA mismatch repair protein n=1 Tax=Haematococcus lacustris TaxID=44745 RepID=A0A6A0A2M0_HAELA|nr:DNA mismatch repair protein [Haematococcus lacustris]
MDQHGQSSQIKSEQEDSTHDGNENDDTNGASWAGSCLEKAGWRAVFQLLGGLLACLEAVYSLSTAAQQLNAPRVPLLLASTQFAEAAVGSLEELLLVFDVDQDDGEEAQAGSRLQLKAGAFPDYDAACQEVERLEGRLEESWTLQRAALVAKGATPAQARRMEAVDEGVQGMAKAPAGLGPMLTKSGYQLLGRQGACVLVQLDWLAPLAQLLSQAQAVQQTALRSALSGAAAVFSTAQPVFTRLLDALAQLDALAGMAVATRPGNAPPGCTFCRPHFTAAAPAAGSFSDQRPVMSALEGQGLRVTPDQQVLDLQELWHPLLLYSSAPSAQGMRVTPNTLQLGSSRDQSPLLLLTGPNMGGKSTLLRATCVATIMAHLGCYVPAAMARLAPVDCIFTRMAEGEFKPLHALRPGAAPEGSNGIAVAALAGLPPAVTERARIHSDRLVRVIKVPEGAVLRGCKKTRRKLREHLQRGLKSTPSSAQLDLV